MKPSPLAALRIRAVLRLSRLSRAVAPIPPLVCEKLFFFGGLAAITWGCWMIYHPLGFVVGGMFGFWLSMLISIERGAGR